LDQRTQYEGNGTTQMLFLTKLREGDLTLGAAKEGKIPVSKVRSGMSDADSESGPPSGRSRAWRGPAVRGEWAAEPVVQKGSRSSRSRLPSRAAARSASSSATSWLRRGAGACQRDFCLSRLPYVPQRERCMSRRRRTVSRFRSEQQSFVNNRPRRQLGSPAPWTCGECEISLALTELKARSSCSPPRVRLAERFMRFP
jgi:hypothetical protein